MAEAKKNPSQQIPPLKISRVFHTPRQLVFEAWCSAEHVKQWFSPAGFTVPEAKIEARPGGAFEVCMRAPDGQDHWSRGKFIEVTPNSRLVFSDQVGDAKGNPFFSVLTEVDFANTPGGTRLTVTQHYECDDPEIIRQMIGGAPEGWRTTLDKLEILLAELRKMPENIERSVAHAIFHLERSYNAPAARVWHALTDPEAKAKWFSGPADGWECVERQMDLRPGGKEILKGRWDGGLVTTFDASYHDVIENERLVYSYDMYLDEKKISVSLATIQIKADAGKTILMVTEQGAFLDGYDDAGAREQGTGLLLDALGATL